MNPATPSTFLMGQIHVASVFLAKALLENFQPCQYKGKCEPAKLQYQLEEMVLIGFRLQSSDLINQKDLTAGILQHPLRNPVVRFEFVMNLHTGSDSTTCLAIEATATKANGESAFFEALYEALRGDEHGFAHGLELFCIPMFQGSLLEECRPTFVKAQKAFHSLEHTLTIAGIQDLEDPVKLADGTTVVAICHLLLGPSVASNAAIKFFQ